MSKKPDSRIFIGLAAVALIGGGLLNYMQYNSVAAKQKEVDEIQAEVDRAATLGKELEASNERLNELQFKLAHLERGVQDYQYVPTLLKELEQVGSANGIQVVGVRPQLNTKSAKPNSKQIKPAYDELTIEVVGKGDYYSALKFLQALQRFPKVVAARSVSLSPKSDIRTPGSNSSSPQLEMVMNLKVFVFPEMKAPETTTESTVASSEVMPNG